jgi:hypothetical protein
MKQLKPIKAWAIYAGKTIPLDSQTYNHWDSGRGLAVYKTKSEAEGIYCPDYDKVIPVLITPLKPKK